MGTSIHAEFAACATNCASPDTGNMETLARFGTEDQKRQWLAPLLDGSIRSCFAMTEPDVASSDATNVQIDMRDDGDAYVVNGRKWWCTGAGSLHCKVMILMGKTEPDAPAHAQQSMLLVDMANTKGLTLVRPLTVFGARPASDGGPVAAAVAPRRRRRRGGDVAAVSTTRRCRRRGGVVAVTTPP